MYVKGVFGPMWLRMDTIEQVLTISSIIHDSNMVEKNNIEWLTTTVWLMQVLNK